MTEQITTLTAMFDACVREHKDSVAFIYRDEKITYGEVAQRTESTMRALASLGIKPGDRFAIVLRNSPEFVITSFALMKLGAISVHVNFLVGAQEMAYILKDSGSKGVITQKEFLSKVRQASKTSETKTIVLTDKEGSGENEIEYSQWLKNASGTSLPSHTAKAQDPAVMLYTSGTTGNSKGAVLTHGNLTSNVQAAITHLGLKPEGEVLLCILPMFHIFAWTALVLACFFLPARVVIVESITPPKPWLAMMAKYRVTLFAAVPPIYHVLAKEAKGIKGLVLRFWFFRTVRYCVSGAAPLPLETAQFFQDKFGSPILEGYGLTETSPVVTLNTLKYRKPGTVGKLIPGVEMKIVDDAGKTLAQGEEGEICVRGPNVLKEYFNLPEATKESFTSDGFFKTGDIGKLDEEGYLTICDRKKDMIIIKGLKVFPIQIEAVLLKDDSVQEAAVIGIPSEGGDEIIKAYVAPKKGASIDKANLSKLLQVLPSYKRPRDIEVREELPKNALQKVLKRELRREAMEKRQAQKTA